MKKFLLCTAALFSVMAVIAGSAFTASGNCKVEPLANGCKFTAQPGKGWPQVRIAVPGNTVWEGGRVEMSIRRLAPAGKFPGAMTIGAMGKVKTLKAGYVHDSVKFDQAVTFKFETLGAAAPKEIYVALKNPTAETVLEITDVKFISGKKKADTAAGKKRLAPVPPVMFKGKPFFPLGAYDMFKVGESGKFGSLDERFVEAGGNFCDFGAVYLPPEYTAVAGYKKAYQTHGQPTIFAALDKMKNDPRFKDIALLIGLSGNVMLDDSETQIFGMHGYLKPATGEKLALRKKVLAEAAAKLASYPNVIGYTMDEPENTVWKYYDKTYKKDWEKRKDKGLCEYMISWLNWTQEVIKKNHPGAQMMPIIAWSPSYEYTSEMYDVLIGNSYPHKLEGKKEFEPDLYRVNYDAAQQVAAVRAAGKGKSVIFMPPMYDLRKGHIGYTVKEQLYVMFAPITRGVMGIHGWRLQRCTDQYRKFVIYPAMKEVHKLKEYFLGEWYDELVTSDRDTASVDYLKMFKNRVREVSETEDGVMVEVKDAVPDVSYCLRKHPDGSYLLLAVNNMRTPVTANFNLNLPKLPRFMIDNINQSCKVWIKDKKAQVQFEPFEVHAFILRP